MSEELPRRNADVYERGTWSLCIVDEYGDQPRYSAHLCCPVCGDVFGIPNHTISADGQVTPSVGHPTTKHSRETPCSWHPTPRLLGWPNLSNPQPISFSECAICHKRSRSIGGWGTDGRYTGQIVCDECKKTGR